MAQRQLARRLRELREEAGLTLEEAAPKVDWSTSKLGRIETARQGVDVHGVRSMLDLYGVGGDRWTELVELAREARQKGWWHNHGIQPQGYPRLESDAAVVHEYQLAYMPGLLQTEDYMRALFHASPLRPSAAQIDHDVRVRTLRQDRLTGQPPLELVAIVDESALRRPIGGRDVLRAQLRYLVQRAALPSVCFQVLPAALGPHPGLDGGFLVLGFDEPGEPEIAYIEHSVTAMQLTRDGDVAPCRLLFDRLRSEALSPPDSVALVERLAGEL
ncbi:MAG: helix-turn-helix domain-containing protein [Pseudonocardiaceae bacterium]